MDAENKNELKMDGPEASDELEKLASLRDEALQERAAEILKSRAMQENPLFGQLNDVFSQWEAMMESYRQEELEAQPD